MRDRYTLRLPTLSIYLRTIYCEVVNVFQKFSMSVWQWGCVFSKMGHQGLVSITIWGVGILFFEKLFTKSWYQYQYWGGGIHMFRLFEKEVGTRWVSTLIWYPPLDTLVDVVPNRVSIASARALA